MSEDKYKAARQEFAQWFASNYPGPDTIIHDPFWHAPKVFRAALTAIERNTPEAGVAVTAPHDTPERRMKYHAAVLGVIARKIGYAETVRLLASIPEAQAESAPSEADVAAAIKRMWDGPGNVASWERAGANGAMGEREALLSELYYIAREKSKRDFLDVARAALIAEKVASEPVAWMTTDGRIATDETKNDAMANSSKAAFCIPLFAAPQQPAQSAEQDEPAAYLVRGLDCHNEEYATVWIKRGNAEAAAAAIYRASITPLVEARAASTQSTATQPAQTQVALTDECVRKAVCAATAEVGIAAPGHEWNMAFARAILAAQPASGADK